MLDESTKVSRTAFVMTQKHLKRKDDNDGNNGGDGNGDDINGEGKGLTQKHLKRRQGDTKAVRTVTTVTLTATITVAVKRLPYTNDNGDDDDG